MPQDSIYKGTSRLLGTIQLSAVQPNTECSVSPENIYFPTSYDLGPKCIVVPASPPLWTPHAQPFPIVLPLDEPPVDPRIVLPACPLDPMLRAVEHTCPQLNLEEFDLITDRKNLRALLDFVQKGGSQAGHRIDAEVIGDGTVLFFLGWSGRGYGSSKSYGVNFERAFTGPLSEGTIQHNRVVAYTLGSLNMMIKYQVDAYLGPVDLTLSEIFHNAHPRSSTIAPTGLRVTSCDTTAVAPESVLEIKTIRSGQRLLKPQTVAQMWFSRTPILVAGRHDGEGQFTAVEEINVMESGVLGDWEVKHTKHLQKMLKLVEMIKEHLTTSPVKRQAIVLKKNSSNLEQPAVEFYSLVDSYELGLPHDLRAKWTQ